MNPEVGLLLDNRYLRHAIEARSAENPERLRRLVPAVRETFGKKCLTFEAQGADMAKIEAVHSSFYLQQVMEHQLSGDPYSYDKDTYLMTQSMQTAELAAGGCLLMADHIMAGDCRRGFAMVRPPGHHAEQGRGMGFCILNNVAITAQYLRSRYQLKRILVLDFDVHHGNGTQEVFYATDEVLFVSIHQRGIFPFSGTVAEIGSGPGEGYTINLPVFAQSGDQEYTYLIGKTLQTIIEQYLPQFILVSAGYDGHKDDSISNIYLTTEWFKTVTMMLRQYAAEACNHKLLMVLEGGYNPESLGEAVMATLEALVAPAKGKVGVLYSERGHQILREHPLHEHWTMY